VGLMGPKDPGGRPLERRLLFPAQALPPAEEFLSPAGIREKGETQGIEGRRPLLTRRTSRRSPPRTVPPPRAF
jgi:hypothetical protein